MKVHVAMGFGSFIHYRIYITYTRRVDIKIVIDKPTFLFAYKD